jgi:hypothetical protein
MSGYQFSVIFLNPSVPEFIFYFLASYIQRKHTYVDTKCKIFYLIGSKIVRFIFLDLYFLEYYPRCTVPYALKRIIHAVPYRLRLRIRAVPY